MAKERTKSSPSPVVSAEAGISDRMYGEPAVARRLWNTAILLFLLFLPLLAYLPLTPLVAPISHRSASAAPAPPPPYGPNSPIGQFNDSGDLTDILAMYNKTDNTNPPATDSSDFVIETVPNWNTITDVDFSSITSPPSQIAVIEDDTSDTSREYPFRNVFAAISFRATNSCLIANFSAYLHTLDNGTIQSFLYDAQNNGGIPEPNSLLYTGSTLMLTNQPESWQWFNFTFSAPNNYLNISETYNGYFFIVLVTTVDIRWILTLDASTGNGGYPYTSPNGVTWSGPYRYAGSDCDFITTVGLLALTTQPSPSGVNMQVNGTIVQDGISNAGWWTASFVPTESSVLLDVSATWPITFDYNYNTTYSYTFSGSTYFNVTEGGGAEWNITASISYPNIGANLNSRTINFTIPDRWSINGVYNDSILASYVEQPGWVFIDEPGGAGNGTLWCVVATDDNYLANVLIIKGQQNVGGHEVNITDSLTVDAALQPYYSDGHGNLTIYDSSSVDLYEWSRTPDTYWLNFSSFMPSDYPLSNEKLSCEVIWTNGWHVGVNTSFVYLVYPTELIPEQTLYYAYADDTVILRVYYNDTFNAASPIDGADVNITIQGSDYIMTPQGGGWYQYSWDTTGEPRGNYAIRFWANKTGYSEAIANGMVTLNSRTQLDLSWTSQSIYYNNSVELRVNYTRLTGGSGGISGATVNITVAATTYDLQDLGNGTYTVLLNGTDLDLGTHAFTVRAQTFLHEGQQDAGTLSVTEEPTQISGDASLAVWGGNDFNVTLIYQTQTGTPLSGATISCLRNGSVFTDFNYWEIAPGEYRVNFTFWVQTNTTYELDFTISRYGFANQNWLTVVDVSVIPSILTVISQSPDPVILGDLITIILSFNATDGTPLSNADVNHNWTATVVNITMNGGIYEIVIPTEDAPPGTWHIRITLELINFELREITVTYSIKYRVQIQALPRDIPVEGAILTIGALVTFQNGTQVQPVTHGLVYFNIVMSFEGGITLSPFSTTVSTNTEGWGLINYTIEMIPISIWFSQIGKPLRMNVNIQFLGNDYFLEEESVPLILGVSKSALNFFIVDVLPWLIVVLIVSSIVVFAWRRRVKKRAAQQQMLETVGSSWAQRIMGLIDLRVLFVMYSSTGLPIFTYSFTGGELPSTLLSGFISAVNAFYSELSGVVDRESQLRDIDYKDLHLSLREGKRVLSVLILDASPSEEITDSLAKFTTKFENTFTSELEEFDGRVDLFDPATQIVEKSFHSELLIAYECVEKPPRGFARKIFNLARKLADDKGRVYLPQLFVSAIEKYGVNKKFDIANALEQLCKSGCLVPHRGVVNAESFPSIGDEGTPT